MYLPESKKTHQSPLPSPLTRELEFSLFILPAAAEAKLEVNGDGILRIRREQVVRVVGN